MPVSNECINLFRSLLNEYQQKGELDEDYHQIYSQLSKILINVTADRSVFKDDRIISFLSSSAIILQDAPQFQNCCRQFLISYQRQTNAVDSLVDRNLNIKEEFDSWSITTNNNQSSTSKSTSYSPFFIELQQAIAKRAERMAAQEKSLRHGL